MGNPKLVINPLPTVLARVSARADATFAAYAPYYEREKRRHHTVPEGGIRTVRFAAGKGYWRAQSEGGRCCRKQK
jgi:hypothetical protein